MARGCWKMATEVFCIKHKEVLSIEEFKRIAQGNLRNELGKLLSNKNYLSERNIKRTKRISEYFEEALGLNQELYFKLRKHFTMKQGKPKTVK